MFEKLFEPTFSLFQVFD